MDFVPFLDWDGSGRIEAQDIALSLTLAETLEDDDEDE